MYGRSSQGSRTSRTRGRSPSPFDALRLAGSEIEACRAPGERVIEERRPPCRSEPVEPRALAREGDRRVPCAPRPADDDDARTDELLYGERRTQTRTAPSELQPDGKLGLPRRALIFGRSDVLVPKSGRPSSCHSRWRSAASGIGRHRQVAAGPERGELVEVADDLTSQSRHSLLLSGSPPHGKLLIPLTRRDVRVVEGARLEIALAICDGVLQISITVAKPTTRPPAAAAESVRIASYGSSRANRILERKGPAA